MEEKKVPKKSEFATNKVPILERNYGLEVTDTPEEIAKNNGNLGLNDSMTPRSSGKKKTNIIYMVYFNYAR